MKSGKQANITNVSPLVDLSFQERNSLFGSQTPMQVNTVQVSFKKDENSLKATEENSNTLVINDLRKIPEQIRSQQSNSSFRNSSYSDLEAENVSDKEEENQVLKQIDEESEQKDLVVELMNNYFDKLEDKQMQLSVLSISNEKSKSMSQINTSNEIYENFGVEKQKVEHSKPQQKKSLKDDDIQVVHSEKR